MIDTYIMVGASLALANRLWQESLHLNISDSLDKTEGLSINRTKNYIPILVFLKDGLKVEYGQYATLDYLFEKIVAPSEIIGARNRKVLVILDALDEFQENTPLMDKSLMSYAVNIPIRR